MKVEMLEPSHIYQDVESHPPLMQEEAQRKYIGQEVEWRLAFFSGSMQQDQAHLMFRCELRQVRPFGGITGTVSLSSYPWLKTLPADEPVLVKGRIRRVNSMTIELDILELSIPEPATA